MKKNNLALIISGIVFLVLGITVLITAYALMGADIIGWFSTKWGVLTMVILGSYALILLILFTKDRVNKL